jgi:IclR family pca regulon transcriptional regulator
LAILSVYTPRRPILGIADIADELGMSRSTTHRYVITLLALGYLEQDASRKYRLGIRVLDLGMSALNSMGLRTHASPRLEELRRRSSYAISLAVIEGDDVLILEHVRSHRRGELDDLRTGMRLPLAVGAAGKLLLAALPQEERERRIKAMKLKKGGPNAITTKTELRAELEGIAESGMAVDDEERVAELVAIAVPVRDESGETIAATVLNAPASRISAGDLVAGLGPHVIVTANQISEHLGYRREEEPVAA